MIFKHFPSSKKQLNEVDRHVFEYKIDILMT